VDYLRTNTFGGSSTEPLTDSIDTSTPAGRFFFHVMASLSEMERELLIERTQKGLAAARKRGRVGGRKRLMTPAKIDSAKKLLAAGSSPKEVAVNLGISVPTLYRWLPASERENEYFLRPYLRTNVHSTLQSVVS